MSTGLWRVACATAGTDALAASCPGAARSCHCVGGNPRNQPIAALRDRLDEARLLGIVTEDSTQFRDGRASTRRRRRRCRARPPASAVPWARPAPACAARHTSTCITFGSRRMDPVGSGHAVERGLDVMGLADAEAVFASSAPRGKRASRFYHRLGATFAATDSPAPAELVPFSKSNRTRRQPSDSTPSDAVDARRDSPWGTSVERPGRQFVPDCALRGRPGAARAACRRAAPDAYCTVLSPLQGAPERAAASVP